MGGFRKLKNLSENEKSDNIDLENSYTYQGSALSELEYMFLKDLEEILGLPIPKESTGRFAHGFVSENGYITELGLSYICFNSFFAIPESIGKLAKLKTLIIYHNEDLTLLPENIGNLKTLQRLDINYTSITTLPETLGNLSNLRELYIRHCPITTLPKNFERLTNIESLSLAGNQLKEIPEVIGTFTHLKKLDLEENPLGALPKSLTKLINLEVLQLAGTNLKSLSKEHAKWIRDLKKNGCIVSKSSDNVSEGWVWS